MRMQSRNHLVVNEPLPSVLNNVFRNEHRDDLARLLSPDPPDMVHKRTRDVTVWRSQNRQRDGKLSFVPAVQEPGCALRFRIHQNTLEPCWPHPPRIRDRATHRPVRVRRQNQRMNAARQNIVRAGKLPRLMLRSLQPPVDTLIVPAYRKHPGSTHSDQEESYERAIRQTRRNNADQHQERKPRRKTGQQQVPNITTTGSAHRVAAMLIRTPRKPQLADPKRHENTHDVELNQIRNARTKRDHQNARKTAEQQNAVRKHQALAAGTHLAWQQVILGKLICKTRERRERGHARTQQDHERHNRHDDRRPVSPDDGLRK